ncbi:MAG TPA: GrpB family protein [Gaiellaceae bacterium]|nr:GrpB family protein [Gaiellaceae bacterium]
MTVYVISGPMAAGKSTVARALAACFERGVHLEGDLFRRSIVSGRVEMTAEALAQLRLRYRLAAAAADGYAAAGFDVALEDVVAGPLLGELRTAIRSRPCHVVVLMPSLDAVRRRETGRDETGYGRWTPEQLYRVFEQETRRVGIWLDTSEQTPEETVDEILAHTDRRPEGIVVVDPDPSWPALFERIAEPVRAAVADLGAAVEHVGSTAVPGLAAKPVIDIVVAVPAAGAVPAALERMRELGYVYQGDKGIPGLEAFLWPPDAPRHHLYVVVAGDPPHADRVRFRDRLRADPELAAQYAELKRSLAVRFPRDWLAYGEAKTDFVDRVLGAQR